LQQLLNSNKAMNGSLHTLEFWTTLGKFTFQMVPPPPSSLFSPTLQPSLLVWTSLLLLVPW